MGLRAFGAGLAACSAAAVVAQAQAVAVQQAQQQGSGLAAGLAALGYGGSPLGALGSPAQLQNTGIVASTIVLHLLASLRAWTLRRESTLFLSLCLFSSLSISDHRKREALSSVSPNSRYCLLTNLLDFSETSLYIIAVCTITVIEASIRYLAQARILS